MATYETEIMKIGIQTYWGDASLIFEASKIYAATLAERELITVAKYPCLEKDKDTMTWSWSFTCPFCGLHRSVESPYYLSEQDNAGKVNCVCGASLIWSQDSNQRGNDGYLVECLFSLNRKSLLRYLAAGIIKKFNKGDKGKC